MILSGEAIIGEQAALTINIHSLVLHIQVNLYHSCHIHTFRICSYCWTTEFGSPSIDFSEDFHLFAVTWNSTQITYYVDDEEYYTRTADEVNIPQVRLSSLLEMYLIN